MNPLLQPGDWLCDLLGMAKDGEQRQIFRMTINAIVWGAIAVIIILRVM